MASEVRVTKRGPKAFAFCELDSVDAAREAVSALNDTEVNGRVIKVEVCKSAAGDAKANAANEICRQFSRNGSCVRGADCRFIHKEGAAKSADRADRGRNGSDRRGGGRDRDRDRDRYDDRRRFDDRDRDGRRGDSRRDRDHDRDFGRDRRDDRRYDDRRDTRDRRDYRGRSRSRSRSRSRGRGGDRRYEDRRDSGRNGDRGGERVREICRQYERSGSCVRGIACKFIHTEGSASAAANHNRGGDNRGSRGGDRGRDHAPRSAKVAKPTTELVVGQEILMDDEPYHSRGRSRSNSGDRRW